MRLTLNILLAICFIISAIKLDWRTSLWIATTAIWMNRYYESVK